MMNKIIPAGRVHNLRQQHPHSRIVHCHGVFDVLHIGHLKYFIEAKGWGDILVVSVTVDAFVKKGPGRPKFSDTVRSKMLAALDLVDYVVISPHETAENIIHNLKPDVFVKGPDYKIREQDLTGNIFKEEKAVIDNGGEIRFTDTEIESSTAIINGNLGHFSTEQMECIANIRQKYSVDDINCLIDRMGQLSVLVVGEPIIDSYVFCSPQNISSKSPSISANYEFHQDYAGGSWAVARHLAELGCAVDLIAPRGSEEVAQRCEKLVLEHANVRVSEIVLEALPTPQKTRYVEKTSNQRMFELTNLDFNKWQSADLDFVFAEASRIGAAADVTLALDFGHGLWAGDRLLQNLELGKFVALNVQTNSGNFGYNLFNKHQKYQFLTLDEREMRLGMHDRSSAMVDLMQRAQAEVGLDKFAVTLGRSGSYVVDGATYSYTPNFFASPVDTTGAGDAYFAVASLLSALHTDTDLIAFLGNVYAGLKTQIIGNKEPVKINDLKNSVKAILTI